ncbi:MAG: hypothetical protein ACR2GQ_07875 [Gemmatimonadota bacterium]
MPFRDPRSLVVLAASLVLPSSLAAQDRVDPIPTGPAAVVEALSPFSGPPDSSRVVEVLNDAARTSSFPTSDHDQVLTARLWRLAGQTDLALASLQRVPEGSDAAPLARYEGARVLLEAGHHAAPGLRLYWSACESMDRATRAEIVWDLLAVSTPAERDRWNASEGMRPDCDDIRAFWDERAFLMGISSDARTALHHQRLRDARTRFHLTRPRRLDGMADSFGRPAGLAVDDRGLLLVRMGEPEYDQSCPEEVAPGLANDMFRQRNLLGRCWVYWRSRGYLIFNLATVDRAGGDWPYGDFRIQESFSPQAEPGSEFFQKYVMNADIPEQVKRDLVNRGSVSREAKLAAGYVAIPGIWEGRYQPDALSTSLDVVEARAFVRRIQLSTRATAAAVLERIPDAPDIESTLRQQVEILRFLNPSAGRWQVWIVGAVRAGDLASSSDSADATLDVAGRYSTLAEDGVTMGSLTSRSVPVTLVSDDSGLALRGVVTADPGELPLTVVVEDLNRPGTGAWIQDTINIPAVGGLPRVSDIAVAQVEGGSWTRDGRTYLQVTPAHVTNPDGSIHTYFEVYGVRPGAPYEVELRLAPVDAADRIWRLEPDDLGFRLQFTSLMPGDIGRHHLRLDLGETEPGAYVLAVRIQDEQSKAYSLPAVTDIFVAER